MVDKEWVRRIARLARLDLSEEEVEVFSKQLGDILEFIRQLEELDTEGVEPFGSMNTTPMREDEPGESLEREKALMNAPEREGGFFVVPRIVEVEE